ncbi:hypothetical protein TNCV_868711 [Trichonephila clavipes]|nr:hypothetical protein TNCV_868711 [Trichonephila clavipes]
MNTKQPLHVKGTLHYQTKLNLGTAAQLDFLEETTEQTRHIVDNRNVVVFKSLKMKKIYRFQLFESTSTTRNLQLLILIAT